MSLFASLSMAAMGVCAFAAPTILRATAHDRRIITIALVALALFSGSRSFAESGMALIGATAACAICVATLQAVFPQRIKAHFRDRSPVAMGLFSACLMGGGAVGAQLSPLIADSSGRWQIGLGWMAPLAVIAAMLSVLCLPPVTGTRSGTQCLLTLARRRRTWTLMIGFGIVNGSYSSIVAWLAPYYQRMGWNSTASGSLLAVLAFSQAVAALVIPMLAARKLDRRPWIIFSLGLQIFGFAGLVWAPEMFPISWAIAIGVGMGGAFALFMVVALDHLPNPVDAGKLSAMMQGGGFLIAGSFPWVFALLGDRFGQLSNGWLLHIAVILVAGYLALRFRPDRYSKAFASAINSGEEDSFGPSTANERAR